MKSAHKFSYHAITVIGLALVFLMYTQPDFMVSIANLVWACF